MENRTLTCIGCPLGCEITVTLEDGVIMKVAGQTCKRGEIYARQEVTNPVRTVTGTVRVTSGSAPVVSVRTRTDIPKGRVAACAEAMKHIAVQAPVEPGDVILADVAGTGVDLVATRRVLSEEK